MILVGSRALKLRAPALLMRNPLDFDWVLSQEEYESWIEKESFKVNPTKIYSQKNKMIVEGETNCEFEIIKKDTSSDLLNDLVSSDKDTIKTSMGLIPSLDMLFTIKSSHKYLKNSPHFWKTLIDYHVMKLAGAKIRPEYESFFSLREKETYDYSHPKLNQTKENFFSDDLISYKYEHDTIHQSVATFERPAYTYYLKDSEQVQCDKNKFFSLPFEYQLAGVVEEAAVLAIERSLIPNPGVWTPEYAWKFALSKVCTSITSGWFRKFAWENCFKILKLYPNNYWDKFQKDVESGLVKPFIK